MTGQRCLCRHNCTIYLAIPVPSHLGVKLPATPAPPAPVTDTGAPKKWSLITHRSHVKLVKKDFQFSKCELHRARQQPEASTGHTSPFKPNGERTLQDSSPLQRRKCVKYVRGHQSTLAENVSTVEPSIAPAERDISRKIELSKLLSNTQAPGTKTARNKDNGNNARCCVLLYVVVCCCVLLCVVVCCVLFVVCCVLCVVVCCCCVVVVLLLLLLCC